MELAALLSGFLKLAKGKKIFRQPHLSLYSAILVCHYSAAGANPFRVSRRELMEHASIRSYMTYHKCMTDLIDNGIVAYEPSYHPTVASRITLLDVRKLSDPAGRSAPQGIK